MKRNGNRDLYRLWGANVKTARNGFWKQKDLAAVCGISAGALSNIEAGRRCPNDQVKLALAGALRRTVGELFPWPADIPEFPLALRGSESEVGAA